MNKTIKDGKQPTDGKSKAEIVIDKYSLHKRLLAMHELIEPVESRSATKALHFQEYSAMSNTTSVDYYDRFDLIIDDEGFVTFKSGACPLGEDSSDEEVAVGIVDGRSKLHGQSLDRHLSEIRFIKRIQGQQPGWYHWEQIEELSLARGHGELHFRVIVKEGSKPWPKPTGLVNYYLNVSDRGTAVYHPDATDQEHRDIKDEFDEFKKSIQHMEKVGKDFTETSSKRLSNLRIVK